MRDPNTRTHGPEKPAERQVQLAETRTELSVQRTRDALERTLMSWIRTCLSMISFGFGLFKVLQYVVQHQRGDGAVAPGANLIMLALVGMGTLLLVLAILQHRSAMRELRKEFPVRPRLQLALLAAACVVLVGAVALAHLVHEVLH